MTLKEQVNELSCRVEEFVRCVDSLPGDSFLEKMDDWSPRDILAHLIGWNRYTIEGSGQIRNGHIPFYLVDPGDDFSKVNAVLVRQYSSRDKRELLDELETSCQELKLFLLSLDPADWERDYGVRHQGFPVTIQNNVEGLIDDYLHHREQIEAWSKGLDGT
jgi:hypothetical protein